MLSLGCAVGCLACLQRGGLPVLLCREGGASARLAGGPAQASLVGCVLMPRCSGQHDRLACHQQGLGRGRALGLCAPESVATLVLAVQRATSRTTLCPVRRPTRWRCAGQQGHVHCHCLAAPGQTSPPRAAAARGLSRHGSRCPGTCAAVAGQVSEDPKAGLAVQPAGGISGWHLLAHRAAWRTGSLCSARVWQDDQAEGMRYTLCR